MIIKSLSYKFINYYRNKYIYNKVENKGWNQNTICDSENAAQIIRNAISDNKPCLISRFGSNELDATINYKKEHPLSFLRTIYPFWVSNTTKERMITNAGFFSNDNKSLSHFSDLIVEIVGDIDILGTWIGTEGNLPLSKKCQRINLMYLEPFWSKEPWTTTLKGKRVIVVHPFAESIRKQYEHRELLFGNPNILPEFESLNVIQAIQSIGGDNNGFNSWFDALHYMEDKIDNVDYDVALIGCGAYGMPLAAHCKKMGKKAVHLGGALQLLFGIRGNRWETELDIYKQFMNEHWTRPLENERPSFANNVENACYW